MPLPLNSDKREYKNSVARAGRQRETTSTHLHFPSLRRHVRDDNAIMDVPQGRELIIIIIFLRSTLILLVSSSFLLLNASFAIPILVLTSSKHLPSSETKEPRHLNLLTCSTP